MAINLIMKKCKLDQLNCAEKMLKTDAGWRLRNRTLKVNRLELGYRSALGITDPTKASGGRILGFVYKQRYNTKRPERLVEEMTNDSVGKFVDPSRKSMARIVMAITTRVTNYPKLNNQLKEGLREGTLGRARSDKYIQHWGIK